ncbi:MAG: hypothetical protein M3Y56_14090 [Armatimonadota bacterium]|nr:hypothetical protein [Armatimonadota bacterium]
MALVAYAQDYDEKYPTLEGTNGNTPWDSQLLSLVKSTGVFKCPDDSSAPPAGTQVRSYGMNHWNGDDTASPAGQNLSKVSSPATTILIAEKEIQNGSNYLGNVSQNGGNSTEAVLYPNNGVDNGDGNGFNFQTAIHNGQTQNNYAFCDGHVKSIRANGGGTQGTLRQPGDGTVCASGNGNAPCVTALGTINLVPNPSNDCCGYQYGWGLWTINQQ